MTPSRRALLGALPVLACLPRSAFAAPSAAALYRDAVVINGNLMLPIDDEKPLDKETRDLIRASGLTAAKMTIGGSGGETRAEVVESIAGFDKAVALNPDLYMKITGPADFARAKASGRLGVIYSFEAAEMLEGDLAAIDQFRGLGVLIMGLSYNRTTPFASGTMSPQSMGLTALGRQAVERMNAKGVTVDVSHSDETSSLAAIEASTKPVLITHAGSSAVHAHPRNKSDTLMRALAKRGGVIGIYELSYLTTAPAQPSLEVYLAHLTHALKVCGEDHVGIGSDALLWPFDTSPESLAEWNKSLEQRKAAGVAAPGEGPPPFVTELNRPDRCAVIADALCKKGYSSRTVEKVLGGNFRRVFNETWTA
ncbi:dipeptidase [Caulobacter hibisci]|uniref:Membrane dipeptidase n=1 Tax=Caulobacter hibisci TaxID=2035993 RepID=A0ABS0SV70_9CAUL|nr:membrane dipeptidase [Caulobacter hibisci]MBI1683493.1 membrane dipeptidase [Caulobacter hibisci]